MLLVANDLGTKVLKPISRSIAAALVLFLPVTGEAGAGVVERLAPGQPPLVEAHLGNYRGHLEGGYPENSLAAIEHAIEIGADWVYVAVQVTRDGRYILMHDPTLNQTTDVEEVFSDRPSSRSGPMADARRDLVSDYTLEEIKQLQLTDGSDGDHHPVPTLEDALALINGRVLATISLKSFERDSLLAAFDAQDTDNLILFSTLDARWVQAVSAVTGIKVQASDSFARDPVARLEGLAETFGPSLVSVAVSTRSTRPLPPELVERAKQLKIRLGLYLRPADIALTRGDTSPWEAAPSSGATMFTTDHPSAVLKLLGR